MASLVGILRRRPKPSDGGEVEDDSNTIPFTTDCYACIQVGVPVFHSTSCDVVQAQQPQWEASAGSSLIPIHNKPAGKHKPTSFGLFRRVYDPRSKSIQRWNRFVLLARGMALAVDPLFIYVLSIGHGGCGTPCLYVDGGVAVVVAGMRTLIDCFHVVHMWLQFRVAYVSRESLVIGCGKLVWDPQSISSHYLKSVGGFWYDAFVILPVPQVVLWLLVPRLIEEERIKTIMTTLLLIFVFQFLPKVYHSISLMTRMAKVTGYIFGTIWWGFALNLIAYFIASHVAGGCWYALAIQRVILCLRQQCANQNGCILTLSCAREVSYEFLVQNGSTGSRCAGKSTMVKKPFCLDPDGPYHHGIYQGALPVISSNCLSIKILYTIFWGLMSLSTFGNNLDPTSHWLEVMFSICIVLSGMMLFTLLIGNIQVFLHAFMARKKKMQLRCRDMEWWMKRRQLPSLLRQRVRHHQHQNWAVMGGAADEMDFIKDFPEGLRLDIKRFLCLDLIRMVPLFHDLEDLILDNICDRIKPLVFSKDEKIIREGDVVQRMVFIVQGSVKSNQNLSKGVVATSILYPGGYLGDELLSWCLRRPTINRLPSSSTTFTCLQPTEAFGLDANHLRYITDHFRYKFANERLKRTVRYYSLNWRTWAAVNIQLGWRRYVARMRPVVVEAVTTENGGSDRMLRQYAAIFMAIRPHDHLE